MARGEQLGNDFICGEGLRTSLRSVLNRAIFSHAFTGAPLAMWLEPRSVDSELRSGWLGMPQGRRAPCAKHLGAAARTGVRLCKLLASHVMPLTQPLRRLRQGRKLGFSGRF